MLFMKQSPILFKKRLLFKDDVKGFKNAVPIQEPELKSKPNSKIEQYNKIADKFILSPE